jgi:hypothetical protein
MAAALSDRLSQFRHRPLGITFAVHQHYAAAALTSRRFS